MRVKRKELYSALQILNKVVDHKSSHSIIQCIKFHAKDGILKITGTDLDRRLTAELECEGELEVCLTAKHLPKLVKPSGKTDESYVEIEVVDENTASVEVDDVTTTVFTKPAEDFPAARKGDWILVAMWSTKALQEPLSYVLTAASGDITRPHICSVLFDTNGVTAATDGHRLHKANLPSALEKNMLIPAESAEILKRLLREDDQVVIVRDTKTGQARMCIGKWALETKIVDAVFPPYDQVIPKMSYTRITVDGHGFTKAIKRLEGLCNKPNLKMAINGDIRMSAESEAGESSITVTPVENNHEGEDLVLGVKSSYLVDAIGKKEQVQFSLCGELDPIRIDHGDFTAVVMPMRI